MLDYPKTLEEIRSYRYHQWAGNPKGRAYSEGDCACEVWIDWGSRQCSRKNGHGINGLYCKQHAKILEK